MARNGQFRAAARPGQRALVRERVGHVLSRSQAGTPLALLFIDLDDSLEGRQVQVGPASA
jgi:hypothetical protein